MTLEDCVQPTCIWNSARTGPRWAANEGQKVPDDAQTFLDSARGGSRCSHDVGCNSAATPVGWRAREATASEVYRQLSLFGDVFERVRTDYVEKPDDGKLIESAINGMLAELDPHSSYMDSKSLREMQVEIRGEFGGVGIEVTMEEGSIRVVAPIDETPAAKAEIMANDIITHLDDEPVQGLTLDQVVERMRGPVNTEIKLKIMRKGQDKPVGVAIIREIIRVRSVRSRLEGDDVGLIRVTQFNEQAAEGLKKAIIDLTTQSGDNLKGFVIDLRNNPGDSSIRRFLSPTRSLTRERSCPFAAVVWRTLRASMHTRAISPRESRLLF